MNRPFSVYLDIVRFAAAVLVYLWHSNQRFLTQSILPASDLGHSSVIVFFVLSGFVIAYITDTKESIFSDFAASRFARVYSVALPAIVITLVLDSIGRVLYPAIYVYPFDHFFARIAGSVLMANEVWLISITSFSNVPYWSICYEWWYYVTFAMVTFLPFRTGLVIAILTMIVIGPKLILLAPVWWTGVLLYRWRQLLRISLFCSWVMVAGSIGGMVLFHHFDVMLLSEKLLASLIGDRLLVELAFSKRVFADYLLAILVFINFAGVRNVVAHGGGLLLAIATPVRFFANFTFTLYLLHQPLFLFWSAVIQGDPRALWYWTGVTILTMLSVGLIGFFTEARRHSLRKRVLPFFQRLEASVTASFGGDGRIRRSPTN